MEPSGQDLVLLPRLTPPPGCAPYLVASIPVGDTPRGVAVASARGRVYVANYGKKEGWVRADRASSAEVARGPFGAGARL